MMFKRILPIICLLVCLFAMASVCASDAAMASDDSLEIDQAADDVANVEASEAASVEDDNNVLELCDESDKLNANPDGSFKDLAKEIADSDGELKLTGNYAYDSNNDSDYVNGIVINKPITIDGNGFSLNGANSARAFEITSDGVILKNINIVDCSKAGRDEYAWDLADSSSYGGAIYWTGNNATIYNCNFTNCLADDYANVHYNGLESVESISHSYGGAIYWTGNNASISNCNFKNCRANSKSNINIFYEEGEHGAETPDSYKYRCYSYGGAIYYDGNDCNLFNCSFMNCYSYTYNYGENDNRRSAESIAAGGAIYGGSAINCSFINCYSHSEERQGEDYGCSYGGALYDCSAVNCNFTGNYVKGHNKNGGAVYFRESDSVINCSFTDNVAFGKNSCGGAVYFGGNGTVTNCSFTDNKANGGGAVYFYSSGNVTNCNFTNNKATGGHSYGGAVGVMGSNKFTINNSFFIGNSAMYGGAVIMERINNAIINNTYFINNSACNGSAIYISRSGNVFFNNSSFLNNKANASELFTEVDYNSQCVYAYRLTGNDNYINAIYSDTQDILFQNVEYWAYPGIVNSNDVEVSNSFYEIGQTIIFEFYDSGNNLVKDDSARMNMNYDVKMPFYDLKPGVYTVRIYHPDDTYYTYVKSEDIRIDVSDNLMGDFQILQKLIDDLDDYQTLKLSRDFTYTPGWDDDIQNGIIINKNSIIIDGDGKIIDIARSNNRAFAIMTSGVTIKNLTIKNANFNGDGGAIYFSYSGTVENCNFTDNKASASGGAVYFNSNGNVTNCNFINNKATVSGGAVYFYENSEGTVTNCNFTDNKATGDDSLGGAVYFYSSGNVTNCNFTDNSAEFGVAVYFLNNGEVTNCNFVDNKATSCDGGAIYFSSSGTVKNCNFTNNTASVWGGAIYFSSFGTVTNCNFVDNKATSYNGGAVFFFDEGTVKNCNFTNNSASDCGGAIWFTDDGTVENCNFTNNSARYGGAIYFEHCSTCNVTNCNFIGNNATAGSAIYFYSTSATKTVSNSIFLNNRANAEALEVTKNDNDITIIFTGKDNLLNAIYCEGDVTFTNVTYWGANGIANTGNSPTTPARSNKEAGQNITVGVVVNGNLVLNEVKVTDENGTIVLPIIAGANYYISARHDADSYYTEAVKTISNMTHVNVTSQTTNNKTVNITAKSNILNEVMPGKLLFIVPNSDLINATYAGNGTWWATHTFEDAGDYKVNASYVGLDNVTVNNATISIRYDASVDVNNKTLDLLIDETFTIVATTTPEGLNVSYVPDDSGVYSIDENGNVIALREGEGSILIKVCDDGRYAPNSTIVNVTVSKVPTEIIVANDTLVLSSTDEIATGVTLTPPDAGNVTYSLSNSSVVKVEDGRIIALAEGKATITVSFEGNNKYLEAENKTINVTVRLNDASVSAGDVNVDVNGTVTIGAVTYPEGIELEYVSADPTIAEVDKNGVVKAHNAGNTTITITTKADGVHVVNSTTINVFVNKIKTELIANDLSATYNINKDLVITLKDNKNNTLSGVNITVDLNGTKNYTTDSNGQVKIPTKELAAITYKVSITFNGTDEYLNCSNTITVTILKETSKMTTQELTTTYNVHKYLTISLKDNQGNPIRNAEADITIHGVTYPITSDDNGNVKLIIRLNPGTYTAKITFDNPNYSNQTQYVKVTVLKAKPKITAKKKTFKKSKKIKKYTVTLKANGKAIKKAKLTLKIKGKTYKAKTNSKGKATFKIKNLKKKGTYNATIKFKGNKYYIKSTKKVKIIIK